MDNYKGYNINTGSLMTFDGDGFANITRIDIDEIYSQNDGAVIKAYNQRRNGLKAYFKDISIDHIIQENLSYSAAFISTSSGKIEIENLKINSIKGLKSGLLYSEGKAITRIRYSEILNFYSKYAEPIFYIDNNTPCPDTIFYVTRCSVVIEDSEFNNIHECYKYNDCSSFNELPDEKTETSILYLKQSETAPYFVIKRSFFNEVYGKRGMYVKDGVVDMYNCVIKNSYFQYGFTYYTNLYNSYGYHNYINSTFENNISEIGTFFYFDDIGSKKNILNVTFNNIKFINNTANLYGGIIYSNARKQTDLGKFVVFKNCIYENNNAIFGKISYIYDDSHAPSYDDEDLDYINKLKLDKNNFVTNPTHIEFDNYNDTEVIVIHSDERIEKEYSCSIYDDYGNKFSLSEGINDALLDDLIIYELTLINVENKFLPTKIYGSYQGYCLNSSCKIKDLRLVGKPGDYKLELKIVSFGRYYEFRDNTIEMNVKILECNETEYINQDKNGISIKSCYKPICDPPCDNNGECINDNVCDCSKTPFKGTLCSERYKQKRYLAIDLTFRITSFILIGITIISTIILYLNRNHEIIKSVKSIKAIDSKEQEYVDCEYHRVSMLR
ncbi:hypothetical protein PIROE2DRAFT_13112 [Piromyces sp. E2]|nr:hypothetical protein PIROE2DRAFT_13112 [Piromyces sp. E2]|eukprot:OUM60996.1 hypothetical protein PIROE2DRAFT_13112 [Piromyces sp. E2]